MYSNVQQRVSKYVCCLVLNSSISLWSNFYLLQQKNRTEVKVGFGRWRNTTGLGVAVQHGENHYLQSHNNLFCDAMVTVFFMDLDI